MDRIWVLKIFLFGLLWNFTIWIVNVFLTVFWIWHLPNMQIPYFEYIQLLVSRSAYRFSQAAQMVVSAAPGIFTPQLVCWSDNFNKMYNVIYNWMHEKSSLKKRVKIFIQQDLNVLIIKMLKFPFCIKLNNFIFIAHLCRIIERKHFNATVWRVSGAKRVHFINDSDDVRKQQLIVIIAINRPSHHWELRGVPLKSI